VKKIFTILFALVLVVSLGLVTAAPVLAGIGRTGITQVVAAGWQHTVGLKSDGTVVAVGDNSYGQCNAGGWTGIVQVAAGDLHTVGLKSNGTVVAVGPMGDNSYRQCNVGGWTSIIQVTAGYWHTVGLRSDGTVVAVGQNGAGQCNLGGWTDIIQVTAGYLHTVGVKSDGTVVAVGDNSYGQCNVGGWTNIIQVGAGLHHTVGVKSDGTVVAVGHNADGQYNVGGWTNITQVAAGYDHTVGLKSNGTVVAVGLNDSGQCNVGGWTGIIQVAARSHTVGLKSDGTVVAVGLNDSGQCNVDDWILRVPETYTLTISSTAGGSVTTPGERTFTYDAETVVSLVATPAGGYEFVNWTGNVGTIANVTAASTTITMNSNYSITANFHTGPPVPYNLTISSTAGGSVTLPGPGTFTYGAGTVVNLVAAAVGGYRFVNWTGNVGTIANVNAASTTITMNSNYSIAANFAVIPPGQYGLTISSGAGGSVTVPGKGTFTYGSGTVVNLVATPATGYGFVNWAGDVGTIADVNAATTTITMQGAYKISARFMAGVVAAKTETVTNSTVDAMAQADTKVVVKGTATVTVARYEDNPGGPPPTGSSSLNPLGKYIDVSFNDTTEVTETEIQLYYTDGEVAGFDEESLRLFWWNDTAWVQCSNSGVNTASTNGYSGYMWAKIRKTGTTPTLSQLTGTPWGGYGHPTVIPPPCWLATVAPASGTNTASKLGSLRGFRDTVLLPSSLGAEFVSLYYKTSPPIAKFIFQHKVLTRLLRLGFLDPVVRILNWTQGLWASRRS